MNPADALSAADWLTLWLHFLSLSLLAVGGAIEALREPFALVLHVTGGAA